MKDVGSTHGLMGEAPTANGDRPRIVRAPAAAAQTNTFMLAGQGRSGPNIVSPVIEARPLSRNFGGGMGGHHERQVVFLRQRGLLSEDGK